MPKKTSYNKKNITSFRRAVKLFDTYQDIADRIIHDTKGVVSVTADHISNVLNGKARPSYEVALKLVHIANENIKKSHTEAFKRTLTDNQKALLSSHPITSKGFSLRNLPLMHYEGTNKEYFETTPKREFTRYNVKGVGKSMAQIAANIGVTERTLQKWIVDPSLMSDKRASSLYPKKIDNTPFTVSELCDIIYEQSVQ